MFGRTAHRSSRSVAKIKRPTPRLRVEPLEGRVMLDAGLAPQLLVALRSGDIETVPLDPAPSVAQTLAAWQGRADVQTAEVDQQVAVSVVPNDARFASMWDLRNTGQSGGKLDADIDADLAWSRATGSLRTAVAVIDTGIDYTHPDLYKNIWVNQGELPAGLALVDTDADSLITFWDLNEPVNRGRVVDGNANGRIDGYDVLHDARWANGQDNDRDGKIDDLIGWDFVNNDNDPYDDNGHGTHVAGTIGAMGNNGLGVVGVAWKVQMAALKTLNASGSGYTSAAVSALNYAVGRGIEISNNSWGGGGYSSALAAAISNARAAGHVFVAAAGNNGRNNDATPHYPSGYNYDNVVAVASTDRNDRLSSFSNYGAASVDLAAPGSSILSTLPGGGYGTKSGTSMASPHVAGAVALAWSANPSLSYREVIARVLGSVDTLTSLAGKVAKGGRLNVDRALAGVAAEGTAPHVAAAAVAPSVTVASTAPVTLRNRVTVISSITVNRDILIGDLNVVLNVSHTHDADLNIYLRGPDGTRVDLAAYRGGSGDDFSGTTLDDEAAAPISAGIAPFAGAYRPEKALSALHGKNARGTWKLYVYDRSASDTGRLDSWSLEFNADEDATTARATASAADLVLSQDLWQGPRARFGEQTLRELAAAMVQPRSAERSANGPGRSVAEQIVDLICRGVIS